VWYGSRRERPGPLPHRRRADRPGGSRTLGGALGVLLLVAALPGALSARTTAGASSATPAGSRPHRTSAADTAASDSTRADSVPADALAIDSVRALTRRAASLASDGQHAAAGALYEVAARGRPEIADWLRLSALQQAGRAGLRMWASLLAERLRSGGAVPVDSIELEQVRAALRAPDTLPTSAAAAVAGGMDPDWDPELWTSRAGPVLLAAGDTAAAMAGYRRVLDADGVPDAAGAVLLELDDGWRTLRDVAFSDRREGRDHRAAELLARARSSAPAERRPELALELARTRLGGGLPGVRDAVSPWDSESSTPDTIRSAMELAVGTWALRHGRTGQADAAFKRAASGSGTAAARASYLVADLAHDRHHLKTMRTWLERTARDFPRSGYGHLALMRLGLLAYLEGEWDEAAGRFAGYRHRSPEGGWALGALYWEARAREAGGDSSAARGLLRRLARTDPAGYYGLRAQGRLGEDALPPEARRLEPGGPLDPAWEAAVDGLLRRMDILLGLEWRDRALAELDAARRSLSGTAARSLRLARRLEGDGWSGPAIGLAWTVFAQRGGQWTPDLLRAVYPLPYREQIEATAGRLGIDAALLAGLIRQESAFDPSVVSTAGAVGLTQLLPSTARHVARRSGLPVPDSTDLLRPAVNLGLGARYLAGLLDRYDGSRLAVLVAYNAGPRRWSRWQSLPEHGADPELFIEAIPFAETRRYVKAVFRNELLYRRLHDLPATRSAARSTTADAPSQSGSPRERR